MRSSIPAFEAAGGLRSFAVLPFAALLGLVAVPAGAEVNVAFGSRPMPYAGGAILPSHVLQADLDEAVRDFYDAWKAEYLVSACGPGRVVVRTSTSAGNLTVSEGHGYGMMLLALMAGHDEDAQVLFDGMVAYFLDHPTNTHDRLMAWNQSNSCNDVQGSDSATDGDLDIAFALLLAHAQWGSCGAVDYENLALEVLEDVLDGDIDASASWPLLGDWVTPSSPEYHDSTRVSDFLTDHFASFAAATGAPEWSGLRDSVYAIVADLQASHAPDTGLLPDFLVDPASTPSPAPSGFLEGDTDGTWSYNACRVPWRLATDFVVSGDARAKAALDPVNAWIRDETAGDPGAIGAGYALDGSSTPGTSYTSMAFVAPFAVGAMVDASNQDWLNDLWDFVVATPLGAEGYYENTLKLLSMVVLSGNWWAPESVGEPVCTPAGTDDCTNPARVFDASVSLKRLDGGPGAQQMTLSGVLHFPSGAPAGLDVGAQVLVEDAGSMDSAIFDLREATTPIPGAGDPACDPRDGWKSGGTKTLYRNKSGALGAPACAPGSANGLSKLQYRDDGGSDLAFQVRTKRSTIASPVGPLRVTLVLGDTAAAGDAGECGVSEELACEGDARSLWCQ